MSEQRTSPELVTEGQIFGWRVRVREINEEVKALVAERDKLTRLIEMAQLLATEAKLLTDATGVAPSRPRFLNDELQEFRANDSFPVAVLALVRRADDGVTHADLRAAIEQSPLAERFRDSEKGFYHAIRRLKDREQIVDHHGYFFTPENLIIFKRKVAAGLKHDKEPNSGRRGSLMTDLILETIAKQPGLIARDVIARLISTDDEMRERLQGNENSAYNAIARLRKRQELVGRGANGRELHIGPKADEKYQRLTEGKSSAHLFDEIEASGGGAPDASMSGETQISPFENRRGIRPVG